MTAIVGPNGDGKTNLVEAIYFGLTGRSFRTADRRDLIPFGEPDLDGGEVGGSGFGERGGNGGRQPHVARTAADRSRDDENFQGSRPAAGERSGWRAKRAHPLR